MADLAEPPEDVKFDAATEKNSGEPVDDFQAEFEKLVQMDQDWRDHFSQANTPIRSTAEDEEKRQFMFDSITAETSLAQHLVEQVRDTELNEEEQGIAELLIGNIDDYGYLKATVEELAASTSLTPEKISEVLKVIQTFEPVGRRGARSARMPDAPTRTRRPAGNARIPHRPRFHGCARQTAHPRNRARHRPDGG